LALCLPELTCNRKKIDDLVKSQKASSPLMGGGEGEESRNFARLFIPLPPGEILLISNSSNLMAW
jgi:hypothetical protein